MARHAPAAREHARPGTGLRAGRVALAVLVAAGAGVLAGCFDAPRLEDRWTRVDLQGANVAAFQTLTLGATESVSVHAAITYRQILTGYAVAELRVSPTMPPGSLPINPDATRLPMAQAIDSLLQHSVSIGRATRAVTGWDHLIQGLDFSFSAAVPLVLDSTGTTGGGVFMVCYLGSGDKVRRLGQADTIVVTPFKSAEYQILPVGMKFRTVAGPGAR
jgi:hypothetical protein